MKRRWIGLWTFACIAAGCSSSTTGPGTSGDSGSRNDAGASEDARPGPTDAAGGTDAVPADAEARDASVPDVNRPYAIQALDKRRITQSAQVATGTVAFDGGPFALVKVRLELESPCYPFEKWAMDPPPMGQSWPADCDAFDRNFELTIDPPAMMSDPPGLEIIHAITPFGGPLALEHDITDLANGLSPGIHRFSVLIPTYSDGAGRVTGSNGQWFVSLRFEVTPGTPPRRVLAVIPLLNLNHGAGTSTHAIPFQVPAGTMDARIEYRTSGHGGGARGADCIGPAEEFCRRSHRIWIDGSPMQLVDTWRTNCADLCTVMTYMGPPPVRPGLMYCGQNPCGAIQSVRAPRANWCPGSETPPNILRFDAIKQPGMHTFSYDIQPVVLSGGSWRVSAIYFAYGDSP